MIIFETIRWKNLLSTGNAFTEIPLNKSQNALIIGENGAGKSTILDALCFALFGKAFRRINKPNLVNSVNERDCVVEIEFSIGSKQYKIVRGIKPNIFEIYCNNILVNQDSAARDYQEYLEKQILRMNYKSFTQIVILGSASFTPFMQLTPADRRVVIEDLLDIQIFSTMNIIAKQKMQANKEELERNRLELNLKQEKKTHIQKTLKGLKENTQEKVKEYDQQRTRYQLDVLFLQQKLSESQQQKESLLGTAENLVRARNKHKNIVALHAKIDNNLTRHRKDHAFFGEHNDCPTCRQIIEESHKQSILKVTEDKIAEISDGLFKLDDELEKAIKSINDYEEQNKKLNDIVNQIDKLELQIRTSKDVMREIDLAIEKLNNSDRMTIENEIALENVNLELAKLNNKAKELLDERQYLETAINLLKDGGIKTKIIKQYIPIINKYVNKYLTQMGFFVKFNINENFEEVIKSRHHDEFSYQNFSEGEKMRIDLALLFTWRQVARMKNSVNTNLLILDEVMDGSLDTSGTEEFLKIMWDMIGDTNTFVISHKVDAMLDKFQTVYRFVKKKNFSRLDTASSSV